MFKLSSDHLANFRSVGALLETFKGWINELRLRIGNTEDRLDVLESTPDSVSGATDHGALTGLADDDHTQYHNNARGDARYSKLGHTHTRTTTIGATFDGRGAALVAGAKCYVRVPVACTIVEATALADVSGSVVVDVWKDTYANYPPTDADSITAAAPITISSATKSTDTTLTGWTTSVAAGDVIAFNIDSCNTITQLNVQLKAGYSV